MHWNDLLARRLVHRHEASRDELDALRRLVDRDLTDAALTGLSHDRRFAIAYNAVFLLGKMALAPSRRRGVIPALRWTSPAACFMLPTQRDPLAGRR